MRWLLGGMLLLLVACTGAPTGNDSADTYFEGGCCAYSCVGGPDGSIQAIDDMECQDLATTQCELASTDVASATWSPSGC